MNPNEKCDIFSHNLPNFWLCAQSPLAAPAFNFKASLQTPYLHCTKILGVGLDATYHLNRKIWFKI